MTFNERLKGIVTEQGAIPYVFGSMAQANLLLDKMYRQTSYPVCVNIQPVEGTLVLSDTYNVRGRDEQHVLLGYADKIALDYDAETVQTQVETLKAKCFKTLASINGSGYFEVVTEVSYSVMFDTMDANLVLVLMDFRLRDLVGVCM